MDHQVSGKEYLCLVDRAGYLQHELRFMAGKVYRALERTDDNAREFLAELAKPGSSMRIRLTVEVVEFPTPAAEEGER